MHRDIRPLVKQMRKKGFTVQRGRGGHYDVRDQDGNLRYSLPSTPGGGRWLANLRAELRRKGLID